MRDGRVDESALERHFEWLIESGVHGLVPCGTTGEAATLDADERKRVISLAVKVSGGKVPVVAGAGTNSTDKTIRMTKESKDWGADAALLVTPYYNKPTQEGLFRHFSSVAQAVDIPLVLYNVPGRTGVNMLPETVRRLADLPQVAAVKEASGTIHQTIQIRSTAPGLDVLSGDDNMYLPHLAVGAQGIISVLANLAPKAWSELYNLFNGGDFGGAQEIFLRLFPACQGMFLETNPIPVKTGLGLMGRIDPELRLPLAPMADSNRDKLELILRETGILEAR